MAKTIVIYNDSCPICRREVAQYRQSAERHDAALEFRGLDGAPDLGLDADAAARRIHVWDNGRLHGGLAAFLMIWRQLPGWRRLASLIDRPGIRPSASWLYDRVAAPVLYALHRRRVARATTGASTGCF